MAKLPLKDAVEVEIVCPHCAYHTARTAARLRRNSTKVVCPNCGRDILSTSSDDEEEV